MLPPLCGARGPVWLANQAQHKFRDMAPTRLFWPWWQKESLPEAQWETEELWVCSVSQTSPQKLCVKGRDGFDGGLETAAPGGRGLWANWRAPGGWGP